MIELYAITDHPTAPLPPVAGMRAVPVDGLAAVCGPAAEAEVSPEALWRHEEIVEGLMADRDLIPVRYGTRLADEAAIVRAVEDRRDELAAALAGVRGAVELSLRVVSRGAPEDRGEGHAAAPTATADDDSPDDRVGARYLRARARASADRDAVAESVERPLAALARASVKSRPRTAVELLRSAYLVERKRVELFTRAVARLQRESPELQLLCTGPWPPYSFVER